MTAGWLERRFGAAIVWLPFDLHPEYPPEGIPRAQLHARYGERFHGALRARFAEEELAYDPPADVVPRSLKALQLAELARDAGRHTAVHDRLMDAYWAEGENIGDPDVLRRIAADVDLPADDVERVLAAEEYVPRIEASTQQALRLGINGIPGWLLDERLLVLGAQPRAVFEQAVAQLSGDA